VSRSETALSALMIHGPRGPFRWTAYALAVTAFAAAIPSPLYPVYEHQFAFTAGILGLVFAAYTPGVLLTLFLVAPQAEQLGRKRLLSLGMLLTAVGAIVFALAPGVGWLAVARFVSGLAVGTTTSVATAAMSDLEPNHDPHHVARVAVAANFGAFALGAALSGLIVQLGPFPTELVYLLPFGAAALGLLAIHVTPETATQLGHQVPYRIQRISVPPAARRPFWVAAGGIAACYSIYGFFAALVPSYVRSGLHESEASVVGAVVALMFGMAALCQLATAQIRDRRALLVGLPLMIVALVALVLILPLTDWTPLLLVTTVLGVAVGLTYMGSVTLIDRVTSEDERGEALAGFYAAGYLALAVPTIGIAELSVHVGLTAAGSLLGALLAITAALLYVGIYRTPTPPGGGGRPRRAPGST
jgi:predicted MFS family arabinose efflux permease